MTNQQANTASLTALERVARVLAASQQSINAEGSSPSAGPDVDQTWHEHLETAKSVLRTLREPDAAMAAAGNTDNWCRMIEAAIANEKAIDIPGLTSTPPPVPDVRQAGPENMSNPPKEWSSADERSDESFPASDPAPVSPGTD